MPAQPHITNDHFIHHEDHAVIEAGYQPKLRRSLGYFASFAVSFSFISITTGIFANYGYVLTKAGPFGFWTWLLVAVGHLLVALVYAEMAGRMPLAGCAYNWNTKLMGPAIGWFTGWLTLCAYSISVAAFTTTIVPVIESLLDIQFSPMTTRCITAGMIVAQAWINISGIRLTSKINVLAVCAELISIVVMGCLVAIAVFSHSHAHFSLLITIPTQPVPYWPAFFLACLLGAFTLIGFETSADMSEETVNARTIAPKGIISSILVSAILGFAFIIVITIAIPNVAVIKAASNPLVAIVQYHLGAMATKIFLIFVIISIFACSLINIAAASRTLYAIARDKRFIAPAFFQKISTQHVPIVAISFVTIVSISFSMMANSLTALYAAVAILPAIIYLTTVICFAIGLNKLPSFNTFSLGKWHSPIVVLAISWLLIEIGILTIPQEFHAGALTVGGVVGVGFLLYLFVGRK